MQSVTTKREYSKDEKWLINQFFQKHPFRLTDADCDNILKGCASCGESVIHDFGAFFGFESGISGCKPICNKCYDRMREIGPDKFIAEHKLAEKKGE